MPRFLPKPTGAASADCRRSSGRLHGAGLRCSIGKVLDLSIAGLAIETNRSFAKGLNRPCDIWLGMDKREHYPFRVEIRSSTRLGFFRHRVGLVFVDLSPEQRMILTEFGSRAGSHEYGWSKAG